MLSGNCLYLQASVYNHDTLLNYANDEILRIKNLVQIRLHKVNNLNHRQTSWHSLVANSQIYLQYCRPCWFLRI
jgi:hypothetical protein